MTKSRLKIIQNQDFKARLTPRYCEWELITPAFICSTWLKWTKAAPHVLLSSILFCFFKDSQALVYTNLAKFPIKGLSFTYFSVILCQMATHKRTSVYEKQLIKTMCQLAFLDCHSTPIKSWFYNHSIIPQSHHSVHKKATSVQWIWLYLHLQWSPTGQVRSSIMSHMSVYSHSLQHCDIRHTSVNNSTPLPCMYPGTRTVFWLNGPL